MEHGHGHGHEHGEKGNPPLRDAFLGLGAALVWLAVVTAVSYFLVDMF